MTMRFAGQFNSYVPQATGQTIAWIRDPARYKLNRYVQYVPTPTSVGVFLKLHVDDPVRAVNLDEDSWPDGAKRPEGKYDGIRHDWVEFQTVRRDDPFTLGWKTITQASYPVLLAHMAKSRNQHMIKRTARMISLAENTASWGANTADANVLNGGAGKWNTASADPSAGEYLAIKKTLDEAAVRIHLATNGMIADRDAAEGGGDMGLMLVISPGLATKMSQTSEIYDYLARSQYALGQITGGKPGQNAKWGLPDQLYGWDIVVENAVRVAERVKASGAEASTAGSPAPRRFIKSDNSAIVCSRPGGLDGDYGAPSFSTFQIYRYGPEMEVETFDDTENRLTRGHVASDLKEVVAAAPAGFLITNVL